MSRKRLGRGNSSKCGNTSGRGQKGQLSRSGSFTRRYFEGGQTPLYLRIPKRGFNKMSSKIRINDKLGFGIAGVLLIVRFSVIFLTWLVNNRKFLLGVNVSKIPLLKSLFNGSYVL